MTENLSSATEKNEAPKWSKEIKTKIKQTTAINGEYKTICSEILVDSPAKENPKLQCGKVFYTAYFSTKENRNIMFLFNGGPGSSSVWLHFGGFGPVRINNLDVLSKSSSHLIDNTESLLNSTDLVFVDPIGTGFSSCEKEELKNFYTEKADAVYLSQFITQFLIQYKLWDKKLFLCGESYGGYRVSLIAAQLIKNEGLHPAGLVLISPFISGSAIEEVSPNILGEAHFLVGYILTAWYHKRSSLNSSCQNVEDVYQQAKKFAYEEFLPARLNNSLMLLTSSLHEKISDMTGISSDVFLKYSLNVFKFSDNLFQREKKFVGRIDSRYILEHPLVADENEYLDPSCLSFDIRMTALTQNYYFKEMEWHNEKSYVLSSNDVSKHWKYEEPFFLSAFQSLQNVLKLSPDLKVYTAAGYFDLAVPAATVEFDLKQLSETKGMEKRLKFEIFNAGHMMYVHDDSRINLSHSIRDFILTI